MGEDRKRVSAALGVCVVAVSAALTLVAAPARATEELGYVTGHSDADYVLVSSGLYKANPGVSGWWDHTNLTIAMLLSPDTDADTFKAMSDAIVTWRQVLADRFPIISLTTITATNHATADIDLRYVPMYHGLEFGGSTMQTPQHASITIRSEFPPGSSKPDRTALSIYRTTLHEIGHALGLGHASPLWTSQDLMGYGWNVRENFTDKTMQTGHYSVIATTPPILSDCDIDGVRATFAWAINHETPHPATVDRVHC